jgi:phosphoglycolate phosphatase-like HAD superfamily hydrolase
MPAAVSSLGVAPIVDFDGTMAALAIDWESLRRELGVGSILELWDDYRNPQWATVATAEIAAAAAAKPIMATLDALGAAAKFVVVTDNDEGAVETFLARYPELGDKALAILGRRFNGGPKRDGERFTRAFRAAETLVTDSVSGLDRVVYCGDQEYEIAYATSLGARVVRVLRSGELVVVEETR